MASTTTADEVAEQAAADESLRRAAVAAEARALLEASMRGIMEGWRGDGGEAFDPSEDVLVVLSGGVDSSLTFHLASGLFGVRHCVTLLAADAGAAAMDAPWCRAVAAHVEQETLAPKGLVLDHEVGVRVCCVGSMVGGWMYPNPSGTESMLLTPTTNPCTTTTTHDRC